MKVCMKAEDLDATKARARVEWRVHKRSSDVTVKIEFCHKRNRLKNKFVQIILHG